MRKIIFATLVLSLIMCFSSYASEYTEVRLLSPEEYQHINIVGIKQVEELKQEEEDESFYIEEIPLTKEEQKFIHDEWTKRGYDYSLALGFADVETGGKFNKDALNKNSHDYGLFQINRSSWFKTMKRELGISSMEDLFNLELNVLAALYIYDDCAVRYGNTERAIVAYNRGFGDYASTKYSRLVLSAKDKWQAVLDEQGYNYDK